MSAPVYATSPKRINRAAIEYVKRRCRLEPWLERTDAHLLLIVATTTPYGRTVSIPIPMHEYAALMRCDGKTVKRAVDRLVSTDFKELKITEGGQGHWVIRFEMVK